MLIRLKRAFSSGYACVIFPLGYFPLRVQPGARVLNLVVFLFSLTANPAAAVSGIALYPYIVGLP
ncbi:hypothetical protein D3C85_1937710 [compost metagenome]